MYCSVILAPSTGALTHEPTYLLSYHVDLSHS